MPSSRWSLLLKPIWQKCLRYYSCDRKWVKQNFTAWNLLYFSLYQLTQIFKNTSFIRNYSSTKNMSCILKLYYYYKCIKIIFCYSVIKTEMFYIWLISINLHRWSCLEWSEYIIWYTSIYFLAIWPNDLVSGIPLDNLCMSHVYEAFGMVSFLIFTWMPREISYSK